MVRLNYYEIRQCTTPIPTVCVPSCQGTFQGNIDWCQDDPCGEAQTLTWNDCSSRYKCRELSVQNCNKFNNDNNSCKNTGGCSWNSCLPKPSLYISPQYISPHICLTKSGSAFCVKSGCPDDGEGCCSGNKDQDGVCRNSTALTPCGAYSCSGSYNEVEEWCAGNEGCEGGQMVGTCLLDPIWRVDGAKCKKKLGTVSCNGFNEAACKEKGCTWARPANNWGNWSACSSSCSRSRTSSCGQTEVEICNWKACQLTTVSTPTQTPIPSPTKTPTPTRTPTPTPTITLTPTTTPIPSPIPILGDVNRDGHLNFLDYSLFVSQYRSVAGISPLNSSSAVFDLDKNGQIDIFDYNLIITQLMNTPSPTVTSTPTNT